MSNFEKVGKFMRTFGQNVKNKAEFPEEKIITAGCSFTKYKWPCWSSYVSWFEPEYNVVNIGASGSSNETIMRSVYNAVNKWSNVEKVYIMWSEPNRYEVVHSKIDTSVKKDESVTYCRWDSDFDWNTF